jgi:hypothetical protein
MHSAGLVVITGPDPTRIATSGLVITADEQRCFFCGEATTDPCVMWSGFSDDVFLHPECAVELAMRLLRDVRALEHRSGYRLAWAKP